TRRLTQGFTNTTNWTWSKSLGNSGFIRDPSQRNIEKGLLSFDHTHQITSNGTYELPFGPGRKLLGNAPGWISRVVEKWQLGGILNYNTGAPLSLTTGSAVGSTTSGIQTISNVAVQPNVVGSLLGNMGSVSKVS